MHQAEAVIVRWIDGDTVVVDVDCWPGIIADNEHIRIVDYDAPERGKEGSAQAFARANELAPPGARVIVTLSSAHKQSFARKIGDIVLNDGTTVGDTLTVEHLTKADFAPGGYWSTRG